AEIVDRVAGVAQRLDDAQQAGGGVEGDGVADAAPLGRICGQDEADLLLGGGDVAEGGGAHREAGEAFDAVGDGPVGGDGDTELVAVVDDLLERERRADDAAVELVDGDAEGDVQWGQAGVPFGPGGGVAGRDDTLDDGDAQFVERGDPPLPQVTVADGATGRPGGGDD